MKVSGLKETIQWYDQNAEKYANATRGNATLDEISGFVGLLPRSSKVLDAGCGSGRDTYILSEMGLDVIGLDLSHGLIAEARKRFPTNDFREGDFLDLPFTDGEF